MSTPRAKKPSPKKKSPAKKKLPPALAQRAKKLHAEAQARLAAQGREAIALIRARRADIAEDYFDIGRALITLKSEAIALALGHADVAAMLRAELDLSVATADKLIELSTRVDRSLVRELQQERAAAILALVDATPEEDTPEDLLARPFPLTDGGTLDLRTAPVAAIKDAARAVRQTHAPKGKRTAGFTTSPEDREAFAALVAPVTKDRSLRAKVTFKLVASRKAHGPLVESRIPLREFEAVVARLLKRR